MGYDMYLVEKVECPDEAPAEVEWNAALAAREALTKPTFPNWREEGIEPFDANTWPDSEYKTAQLRVEAALDRKYAADLNYFRLNIWGMGRCVEIMARLGMVFDAERPGSMRWPEWDEDVEHDPWECKVENCDHTTRARQITCAEFRRQNDAMLRWTPLDREGILSSKFGSNDGWIVLPTEIREALAIYYRQPNETRQTLEAEVPWWTNWLGFMARAADNGGFRVN